MFLQIVILLVCIILISLAQDPVVVLPQGRIVGIKVFPSKSVLPVEIYFGIPYAISPTGRYRFSAPERHPGWRRTFFAHRMPPRCPQIGDVVSEYISEDCLFINIWTPRKAGDQSKLPVVVIMYSETWSLGGITSLPCEELAAEGIVVVTVSYRLHMLGFFTLHSAESRGNLGLLDQYMALLWTHQNIAAFGGDPTLITLMGHSAGAECILHHIASRRSLGLFRRVVMMSPTNIWDSLIPTNHNNVTNDINQRYRELAKRRDCTGSDENILQCLRNLSFEELLNNFYQDNNWTDFVKPITDKFLPESEQFLPRSIATELSTKENKVPVQLDILIGSTNLEALNSNEKKFESLARQGISRVIEYVTAEIIPQILNLLNYHNQKVHPLLNEAILWEFFGSNPSLQYTKTMESLIRLMSSIQWETGILALAAKLIHQFSRVYVYSYSEKGVDLHGQLHNFSSGASHGTELVSLLGDAMFHQVARRQATHEEHQISNKIRGYFVNFIKFGTPAEENEWPKYKEKYPYMHDIQLENFYDGHEFVSFWLRYLPRLSTLINPQQVSDFLVNAEGDNRFRGGIYALSGITVILLLLLVFSVLLLRWQRQHRRRSLYDDTA